MNEFADDIKKAVEVLRKGGVILYPTDTVWGIGCDATDSKAVKRIFDIKKRADSKAMIVLVGSLAQLERTVSGIPDVAYQLIEFSEKPLTIIYDGVAPGSRIAPELIADDGTLGVRLTKEAFSGALCRAFGKPIVSTSVNISGQKPAAIFREIDPAIADAADYICTSRRADTGVASPSTIMRLGEDGSFTVIRP